MHILLDLGNSRLKMAAIAANNTQELTAQIVIHYEEIEKIAQWLRCLSKPPKKAYGVSVAQPTAVQTTEAMFAAHNCSIQWLKADNPSPYIYNDYENLEHLGPDRWFGALGAMKAYLPQQNQGLLYCSFGTATTIDAIVPSHSKKHRKPWRFIGGLILPGPYLMHQLLNQHTARLSMGHGQLQDFPKNTVNAITSGMAAAQIGALVQQILKVQQLCPKYPVRLICAGGGWPLVQKALEKTLQHWPIHYRSPRPELHYYPHAVLQGLASIINKTTAT